MVERDGRGRRVGADGPPGRVRRHRPPRLAGPRGAGPAAPGSWWRAGFGAADRFVTHRLDVSAEERAALAEGALPLLAGARVIVLDGGTMALELARRLPLLYDGTLVTNSPPVASALANHANAEVMLV